MLSACYRAVTICKMRTAATRDVFYFIQARCEGDVGVTRFIPRETNYTGHFNAPSMHLKRPAGQRRMILALIPQSNATVISPCPILFYRPLSHLYNIQSHPNPFDPHSIEILAGTLSRLTVETLGRSVLLKKNSSLPLSCY